MVRRLLAIARKHPLLARVLLHPDARAHVLLLLLIVVAIVGILFIVAVIAVAVAVRVACVARLASRLAESMPRCGARVGSTRRRVGAAPAGTLDGARATASRRVARGVLLGQAVAVVCLALGGSTNRCRRMVLLLLVGCVRARARFTRATSSYSLGRAFALGSWW